MAKAERLFVVVDPADTKHAALERVIRTAKLRSEMPIVKVFVAVDSESVDTRAVNDNLFRDQSWFGSEIRKPLEDAGIEYTLEISWSGEWQKSIVMSSKQFGTDRIYLPVHERSNVTRFSFADMYGAELHIANAYLDSMNYPDRGRLANQTGLSSEFIHVESGYTDEAVAKVASKINADLVVMGTLGQNGLINSRRGNTAARVIAGLTQDIMVVNS